MHFIIYKREADNHSYYIPDYLLYIQNKGYIEVNVTEIKELREAILKLFPITEEEIIAQEKANALELVEKGF